MKQSTCGQVGAERELPPIPARLELVSGRALIAHDVHLLYLYGDMLQLEV